MLPPGLLGFLLEPEAYLAFLEHEGVTSAPKVQFSPLAALVGSDSAPPGVPDFQEVEHGGSKKVRGIMDRLKYGTVHQPSNIHPAAAWLRQ